MYGKKLAYIVKVKDIREIPGADRIELAPVALPMHIQVLRKGRVLVS